MTDFTFYMGIYGLQRIAYDWGVAQDFEWMGERANGTTTDATRLRVYPGSWDSSLLSHTAASNINLSHNALSKG